MQPVALQNFILIENAVNVEVNRLLPFPDYDGPSRGKAQEIIHALNRLYLMVVQQNPGAELLHKRITVLTKINPTEASRIDLKTIRFMFDAHISEWESEIEPFEEQGIESNGRRAGFSKKLSIREALNIANNNIFNALGGTWGPIWGKAQALENVEGRLQLSRDI